MSDSESAASRAPDATVRHHQTRGSRVVFTEAGSPNRWIASDLAVSLADSR